ncbi:MAG TPA: hypothetical protein EYP78_05700 [Candidatus Omnitrophica bacterium]|nr:hypothetical protein [Candidatus Omnitrophota bacterium]
MSRRIKSVVILIVSLLFFYASVYPLFQAMRKSKSPLLQETTLKKLPPELIITTVLLGGFRGILVDLLWMRARKLQEERKYFELVQLSDWIGLLEPYIPEVWVFNAWNLSYNISVEFPTPTERWNWVYQGIKLIRDKALKYIPDSPKIYHEISWIYYNKVSSSIDEFHGYYKRIWAKIIQDTLGDMKLEEIASHPSYEELMDDENVEQIIQSFKEKDIDIFKDWEKISKDNFSTLPEELREQLKNPSFRKIESYLRAKALREKFKLEPVAMVELEKKYFPLDWKSGAAHSLYWIEEGKKKTEMIDMEYKRMVYFSLTHLLEWGRIDLRKVDGEEIMVISPDLSVAPILNKYYEETFKDLPQESLKGVKSSHKSFLRKVIMLSYTTNNLSTAHRYWRYLKDKYPGEVGSLSFSDFISRHFVSILREGTVTEITDLLFGILYQAYWYFAAGEEERFVGLESLARLVYGRSSRENERFKNLFPTFESLKKAVLQRALTNFPPPLASSLRSRIEKEETQP